MLKKLIIKNVALIDCAEIDFENGLNVLSGETGAGKSVVLESLNFVLGAKADKTLIRTGEAECFVKAEFEVSDNDFIYNAYNECDIERDDYLIIQRKFNLDGKSIIKVNGETVNATILKKFTAKLVDIHGQSDHFHLLKSSNQLSLLDKVADNQILQIKELIKDYFLNYKLVKEKLNELGGDESQRVLRLDILNYQINEIEKTDLKEDEEQELLSIKQKLLFQKKISDALGGVKSCISDEGGISDLLSNLSRLLNSISEYSNEYATLAQRIDGAFSELDDVASVADRFLDDLDAPNFNPNEIDDRLEAIKNIKKKYGQDYNEIVSFLESAKKEKETLENFNEIANSLLKEKQNLEDKLFDNYQILSKLRRDSAKNLENNVVAELKELGMPKAQFIINFNELTSKDHCKFDSSNGFDDVEFMFSANQGEPIKPLSNVISGGEMSRFMLAIKAQTAKFSEISTFIFDEIDAGISGLTAKVVAEKLAKISRTVQVVAITHLPQISAMADNNLLIEKDEQADRTVTTVNKLNAEQKIKEITRLISGNLNSSSSIAHAKELIKNANEFKKKLNI